MANPPIVLHPPMAPPWKSGPFRAALANKKARASAPEGPAASKQQHIPVSGRNDNLKRASVLPVAPAVKEVEVFRALVKT